MNQVEWHQNYFEPVGKERTYLDSWSATFESNIPCNSLYFYIVSTKERYEDCRPDFALNEDYILSINNKDVFAGTLEECQEEADWRATELMNKYKGHFTLELLKPRPKT